MKQEQSTREKICQVSYELFMKKTFEKTTMREIAEELGINLSLVNYHFPRKQEILFEIFGKIIDEAQAEARELAGDNQILAIYISFYKFFPDLINKKYHNMFYSLISRVSKDNIDIYYLTLDQHEPSEESVSTSGKYPELAEKIRRIHEHKS